MVDVVFGFSILLLSVTDCCASDPYITVYSSYPQRILYIELFPQIVSQFSCSVSQLLLTCDCSVECHGRLVIDRQNALIEYSSQHY